MPWERRPHIRVDDSPPIIDDARAAPAWKCALVIKFVFIGACHLLTQAPDELNSMRPSDLAESWRLSETLSARLATVNKCERQEGNIPVTPPDTLA